MERYVTFDLGISLGEVSAVGHRRASSPRPRDDAFTWQVELVDGRVGVLALYRGSVREIGSATWRGGELVDRASEAPGFPNEHQWSLVRAGLAAATRAERRAASAPISVGGRRAPTRRSLVARLLGGTAIAAAVAILVVVVVLQRERRPASTAGAGAQAPVAAPGVPAANDTPPAAVAPPTLEEQLSGAASLEVAVALAAPHMEDGADSAGAWLLARYASAHLRWSDVARDAPETSSGLVLKDSERERGRRMCSTGRLRDIERRDLDGRPVHVGSLETDDGDVARFIAVGATGSLVRRSAATLCGVATGKDGDAVVLVGMFELPENQQPAVERP